jgi:hypothetical protein
MITGVNYINQLYFTVLEHDNPLFMLLLDLSQYMESLPSTPVYDIIPPGYINPVRISATPKGITSINSGVLFSAFTTELPGLVPLPDGVYTITYKIQPYDTFHLTRTTLRSTVVEMELDKGFVAVEQNCRHAWYQRWKSDLLNVSIMLSTAHALARLGNTDKSALVFQEVQMETERIVRNAQKLVV